MSDEACDYPAEIAATDAGVTSPWSVKGACEWHLEEAGIKCVHPSACNLRERCLHPVEPLVAIAPDARKGKPPCGECHLRPGETCDVCGARQPPATVRVVNPDNPDQWVEIQRVDGR